MILWLSFRWWYSEGFKWLMHSAFTVRLEAWWAYFSVGTLARTLFAPYKQTFASSGSGAVGVLFRSWVDRTISRFVGLLIRSTLLVAWVVCSVSVILSGLVGLLLWPFIPVFPVLSIIVLAVQG